jgi:ubiquinone/menaquinone biosynthesis C-methylase UbiE
MALMQTNPPPDLQIHATDINPMFLSQLTATLSSHPTWPVKVSTMDACSLTFEESTFDLSFAFFIFAGLADDAAAAAHIYRSLKPGGTAVISVWSSMPWHVALINAHHKTRGAAEPLPPFLSKSWYKREQVNAVMEKTGFGEVTIEERTAWLNLGADLRRWARIA